MEHSETLTCHELHALLTDAQDHRNYLLSRSKDTQADFYDVLIAKLQRIWERHVRTGEDCVAMREVEVVEEWPPVEVFEREDLSSFLRGVMHG